MVPTETVALQFDDESALRAAIAEVRKDHSEHTWVLLTLDGPKLTLRESGGGSGGDEIASRLEGNTISFGLIRLTDQIDESVTTKFVYVKYTAPDVAPKSKASATTLKGAIDALFTPFHVDIFVERADELSSDIIQEKVSVNSGSKSRVVSHSES